MGHPNIFVMSDVQHLAFSVQLMKQKRKMFRWRYSSFGHQPACTPK